MEKGESILEAIYEDEDLGDGEDVEMVDVEEGELVECCNSGNDREKSGSAAVNGENQVPHSKNKKRRANKRNNKRKKGGSGHKPLDINQFVLDTCRRLKEKKSYMVYNAVGCLGVSALSDLVVEFPGVCNSILWRSDDCRWKTLSDRWWHIMEYPKSATTRCLSRNNEKNQGLREVIQATKCRTNTSTEQRELVPRNCLQSD
ncbi:hypothetical protein E1A91_D07G024400v1 [Gossypium mustelinum]|uniref:Uncharacterized protein n=1 Tax=Gossypium mustelinum TaxID=34275 RepID=A0A5D2U5R9_GOSMU|nr:hypothetical protein E1A91_D07G024400v1 [Gossypium mustelinum]